MILNVQGLTTIATGTTYSTSFTCGVLNKIILGSTNALTTYDASSVDVVANGQTILNGASLGSLLALTKISSRENDTKGISLDFGGYAVNGNVELTITNDVGSSVGGFTALAEIENRSSYVNSFAVYKSNNITTTATSLLMYYGGTNGSAAVTENATTIVNNNVTTIDFTQASSLSIISGATNKTGIFYAGSPSRVNLNTPASLGADDLFLTRQTFTR